MRFHPDAFINAAPVSMLVGKSDRTPTRLNRSFREAVENEIERLIDLLDTFEPDADLEPYLAGTPRPWEDDCEGDNADDEDGDESGCGDYEGLLEQEKGEGSDLGATHDIDQVAAWRLPVYDGGLDGYPVTDGEPSLGWAENHGAGFNDEAESQTPRDDREHDAGDDREFDEADRIGRR